MNIKARTQFFWSIAGLSVGALAAINPFYAPKIPLALGIGTLGIDLVLALALSIHPVTARIGVLLSGLFLAVPCFLWATPLERGVLMCGMAGPFAILAMPLAVSLKAGLRERLTFFFSWLGAHQIKRRARSFEAWSLLKFFMSTTVLATSLALVKALSGGGWQRPGRWLAGGILMLAFAEMLTTFHAFLTRLAGIEAPALMNSPYRSVSLTEFWTKRWNPAASRLLFNRYCFAPLSRRIGKWAVVAAFFFSAAAHCALLYMAMGEMGASIIFGTFFLVQPVLIFAERRLKVRYWTVLSGHFWTLGALAVSSPLFVAPVIQLLESSRGTDSILASTLWVSGFVLVVNSLLELGYFVFPSSAPTCRD